MLFSMVLLDLLNVMPKCSGSLGVRLQRPELEIPKHKYLDSTAVTKSRTVCGWTDGVSYNMKLLH